MIPAHIPPIVAVAVLLVAFFGVIFGLYSILTRAQRRTTREIREAAGQQGWQYRLRRWQGNPIAFRIEGRTGGALPWVMTCGNSNDIERRWNVQLALRFPELRGEVDFGMYPRDSKDKIPPLAGAAIPAISENRIAAISGTAASAVAFLRQAQETPSGMPQFDAVYRVLGLPGGMRRPVVDAALAKQILNWPADAAHSLVAWRDPFGLHIHVRLPGPPNWATVAYFARIAEQFSTRVPAGSGSPEAHGLIDRVAVRLLSS